MNNNQTKEWAVGMFCKSCGRPFMVGFMGTEDCPKCIDKKEEAVDLLREEKIEQHERN